MRKLSIIILFILLSALAFGYTLKWPEKEPNIIQQTKQFYEPGIMIVATEITGTISYPDYDIIAPGAQPLGNTPSQPGTGGTQYTPQQLILGSWQSSGTIQNLGAYSASITYNSDGTFSGGENYPALGQTYVYSGIYSVTATTLTVNYKNITMNNIAQDLRTDNFPISFSNNNAFVINVAGILLTYTRTGSQLNEKTGKQPAKALLQGNEGTVQVIESLEFVPKEGASAKRIDKTVKTGMSGTGFVINPDGYIMTNAHVVFVSESEAANKIYNGLLAQAQDEIYQDVASRYNFSAAEKQRIIDALMAKFISYIEKNSSITGLKIDNYANPGILLPGQILVNVAWNADIKVKGNMIDEKAETISWGKDIAILKVNQKNLPALKLGDSDQLSTGEQIFVIGYPGTNVDILFDNQQTIEPTVTSGIVSARRTMTNGVEVIQTDAAINHGNSGGPVFNDKGEVIGLATFGSDKVQNINFIMPINLAKEFMNQINVKNEQSIVGTKFQEGVQAFFKKDCATAEKAMQQVLLLSPGLPYAQEYIKTCEEAKITGLYKEDALGGMLPLIAVIAIVAIVGIGVFYYEKTKGQKKNK
ncbi:MAG: trypsin-like peptidase domain-containing protein [Candidatus Diapherotrites archaeon]|nr:trypsin-like peptidase domain-containing protein [Candidatus Diapherotrites archaeon]